MNNKSKLDGILVPVFSVILGLLLGALIMLTFGYNPVAGYQAMLQGAFGNSFYIGETLRQATPLIFTALGFSVAYTAGFFNIGVAGQALLGWLFSVWFALSFPEIPGIILLVVSLIVGALAGGLWAGIAGFLRAYFNTSEVIVTIMLNYTALYTANYLIRNVLSESSDTTARIPEGASLRWAWLSDLTNNSTLHGGIFLALITAVIVWVFMKKTTAGFEIRAVGLNPFASKYAGMSTKRNIIISMLISGSLAGLGGAMEGMGTFQNIFVQGSIPSIGFDGIAVALLGLGNPVGILFSALLFGALKIGGNSMPLVADVPTEVVDIVIASIIFFVGANYLIRMFVDKRAKLNKGGVK
ncbi:ABC transporter permease [Carnobacterium funditum]|uniref:ABC transporter permease n=1 Tax=Carnobacterium funditum TaxID=2752 RepID=UPI000556F883|nr:ABC transporter permease [Carnobacterium funditum]